MALVATAVAGWVWGARAVLATGTAGMVAVSTHSLAAWRIRVAWRGPFKKLAAAFVVGMALRLAGAAVVFALVLWDRSVFPAAPTLSVFLVVLMTLLFTEMLFLK